MTVEEIRNYCLSLKGVEESIKWENHLCFTVGDKMFFITNPDRYPVNGSFKTTPGHFEELIAKEGLSPAPYLAKHHWVHYDNLERLSMKQWKYFIDLAYRLIFDKLPTKTKKKLNSQ